MAQVLRKCDLKQFDIVAKPCNDDVKVIHRGPKILFLNGGYIFLSVTTFKGALTFAKCSQAALLNHLSSFKLVQG